MSFDFGFFPKNTFNDYVATNPITTTTSAGLKTSADFRSEPYGPNLQPNPDMSGTGGTTSGSGTVNGDVADDWNMTANTGATVTASKTSDGYQKIITSGGSANLNIATGAVAMVSGEVWLAEAYASGLTSTPRFRVQNTSGSGSQVDVNLASGYQRAVFSPVTGSYAFGVFLGAGEGCTIHWTRLRKLSGANAILTELDRVERASTNIYTSDFSSGVDGWTGSSATLTGNYDSGDTGHTDTLRVEADAASASQGYIAKTLVANNRYRASFWYKNVESTDQTETAFRVSGSVAQTFAVPLSSVWAFFTVDFTADQTSNTFRVYANFADGHADNELLFDTFKVDLLQPTLTTTKRVNYVETVLDTSYVDVLDADVARTWAINSGTPGIAGDVITFSDEIAAVIDTYYWNIGESYEVTCTVSGWSGSGYIYLPYDGGSGGGRKSVTGNGVFTYIYTVNNTENTTIYSTAGHDAVVTVNSIRKVGPRNVTVVKDGTNFNVFYEGPDGWEKITEETISDAGIIYNKLHSSYGDSTADATIVRLALETQVLANSEFTDTTLGAELFDGSFDTDTTGDWSGAETTISYESSSFMRGTYTTVNSNKGVIYYGLLTAGKQYNVTFKAKSDRGGVFESIGNNSDIGVAVLNPSITTDWQNYEFEILATQTAFRLYLDDTGSIGDYLDLDDIVVQERTLDDWTVVGIPTATNYMFYDHTNGTVRIVSDGNGLGIRQDQPSGLYYAEVDAGTVTTNSVSVNADSVAIFTVNMVGVNRVYFRINTGYLALLRTYPNPCDVTSNSFELWPVKTE